MYKLKDDILSSSQDNSDSFACRKQFIQTIKFECQLVKFSFDEIIKSPFISPPTLKNISRNNCEIICKNLGGVGKSKNVTGTSLLLTQSTF